MVVPKLYMVLPAYDEERNLPPLLANLEEFFTTLSQRGHDRQYIIVDDGSTDRTAEVVKG